MKLRLYFRFLRYEIYAAMRCLQVLSERRQERVWASDVIAFGDPAIAYLPGLHSRNRPKLWLPLDNQSRLARFYELFAGTPTNIGVRRLSPEEAALRSSPAVAAAVKATVAAVNEALEQPLPKGVTRIPKKASKP